MTLLRPQFFYMKKFSIIATVCFIAAGILMLSYPTPKNIGAAIKQPTKDSVDTNRTKNR